MDTLKNESPKNTPACPANIPKAKNENPPWRAKNRDDTIKIPDTNHKTHPRRRMFLRVSLDFRDILGFSTFWVLFPLIFSPIVGERVR